jgi:hypothetical protein
VFLTGITSATSSLRPIVLRGNQRSTRAIPRAVVSVSPGSILRESAHSEDARVPLLTRRGTLAALGHDCAG